MSAEPTPDPIDPEAHKKFKNKAFSEYFDPCQEAATRSLKCLYRNPDDKDLCTDYFQAYRDCKKRWTAARKAEKRKETKMSLF